MSINGIGGGANYTVQQQAQRSARGADAAGMRKPAAEYDQDRYLQDLNSRLDANVVAGQWNGRDRFGAKNVSTVMIHPDFLRAMHDDPATGAKYEAEINAYAKIDAESRKRFEARGMTLDSSGMYINEKGELSSYAVVSSAQEGPADKPEMVKAKDKEDMKSELEKMLERIEEKRAKEKLEAKRLAEAEAVEKLTEAPASRTVDALA
jgi:hypothetical protein